MQVKNNSGAVGEQSNTPKNAAHAQSVPGKSPAGAKDASTSASHSGSSNQTSEYLKVLSRMEGMLVEGTVPEVALSGFAGAIRKRLGVLSDSQQATLMKLPELKALEVETLEKLPELIKEKIQDAETRPAVMKLLKHPKFSELMRDETTPDTYSPKTMGIAPPKAQPAPAVTVIPSPAVRPTLQPRTVAIQPVAAKPVGAAAKMAT